MVKKIIFILYILVLVCMAAATIVEKSQGTDYAHVHYYGAWWFILIWAVLAALGAFYIIKRKVKCASTLALHLSFIIILAGALLTHISAKRGMIHLRIGQRLGQEVKTPLKIWWFHRKPLYLQTKKEIQL